MLNRPSLHKTPPHKGQFRSPHGRVRPINHPSEAVPLTEVVFRHKLTGRLYAAEPGSHSLRALRRTDPLAYEQVHVHHPNHKDAA